MQFTNLFDEERAVSPVIGVILMVAITVILAAVIGTFVLGLTDSVKATATAGIDYNSANDKVTVVSMGENTQKVGCVGSDGSIQTEADNSSSETTSVGGSFTCASGNSVVAFGDEDAEDSTIRTL